MSVARTYHKPARLLSRCVHSATASTTATAPSLLIKVRNDLKAAMKAKDSARLDVLRGILSEITNAAKSSKPVMTDSQVLNIIHKRVKSSEAAAEEFSNAKREDLRSREIAQISVLQEYMPSKTLSNEDLKVIIQDIISKMRTESKEVSQGIVMRSLVSQGGPLDGQLIDKKDVAKLVQGML